MCTLTIVPTLGNRLRIAFNRDEQRSHPLGLAPEIRQFGGRAAILSTDPVSGGTWLAANDSGLVFALLKVGTANCETSPLPGRSRGEIILALVGADSLSAALATAEKFLDYRAFAPFQLVLVKHGLVADVRWDGNEPMVMSRLVGWSPLMFTSSILGDNNIEGLRRGLFLDLFSGPQETWETVQELFHRHRWPDREHQSVDMTQADAYTVSHTVIDLKTDEVTFIYYPDSPDVSADRITINLRLTHDSS